MTDFRIHDFPDRPRKKAKGGRSQGEGQRTERLYWVTHPPVTVEEATFTNNLGTWLFRRVE
jgi:hypothetical protein